jgi:hypothetical protein
MGIRKIFIHLLIFFMSVISIGALFLLGGILASSATLIATSTGAATTIYNVSNNKSEKDIVKELFSKSNTKIEEYVKNVRNFIKNQLIQLKEVVSSLNTVSELESQKQRLLSEINNLLNSGVLFNLYELENAQKLQNSIKNIVNIFNDLKSQNQIYLEQYNNILNKINEKIVKIKNYEDVNINHILKRDFNSCNLQELKQILEDMEKIELEFNIKQKELALKQTVSKIEVINKENLVNKFQREQLIEKINEFVNNIKRIDQNYKIQTNIENLYNIQDINNLKLIKEQVSLEYYGLLNKAFYTKGYKEKLDGYLRMLDSLDKNYKSDINFSKYYPYYEPIFVKLKNRLNDFLNQKYISKEEMLNIEQEFLDTLSLIEKSIEMEYIKDTFKFKLNEILEDIGYQVVDQELIENFYKGEIIYIDTIYGDNYKIQAKLEDGKLFLRLVKVFEDQKDIENLTEYEKRKDYEVANSWCKNLDKIIEKLKENGILMETIKRIEPTQAEITYIVNKELIQKNKGLKSSKKQKVDKYLAQDF